MTLDNLRFFILCSSYESWQMYRVSVHNLNRKTSNSSTVFKK